MQGAVDELTQELGRSPTITDIGERVGVSEEDVVEALEAGGLRRSSSLEATLSAEDSRSLAATFGAEDPQLAHLERALTLGVLLERLPELERQIVHLRFVEGMTQLEIARRVGRSQMQISRMLARTLGRLRAWADDTRRSAGSSSA